MSNSTNALTGDEGGAETLRATLDWSYALLGEGDESRFGTVE
jgi:hypothetical protein